MAVSKSGSTTKKELVKRTEAAAKAKTKKKNKKKEALAAQTYDEFIDTTEGCVKLFSWNVNGIRCVSLKAERGFVPSAFSRKRNIEDDVIAFGLQEIKCSERMDFPTDAFEVNGELTINGGERKGYAGTCMWKGGEGWLSVTDLDLGEDCNLVSVEGRGIVAEHSHFYYVVVYVPNSGDGLKRLEERIEVYEATIRNFLKGLNKPVIYCGDLNVAASDLDLANPKSNYNKTAGFTQREIDALSLVKSECKMVDAFREKYPETIGDYTYWGYRFNARGRNMGWRLDYFLISESLKDYIVDIKHHSKVTGSDHCPIELVLNKWW